MSDDREYHTCDTCSYGVSGEPGSGLDKRLDAHEVANPGHRMWRDKEDA